MKKLLIKNLLFIYLTAFFLPFILNSQTEIDSLKSVLNDINQEDTTALKLYFQIGQIHQRSYELDSAIVFYQKVIDLDRFSDNDYYLRAIFRQGVCYIYQQNFEKVFSVAEYGLKLTDDPQMQAKYHSIVSGAHMDMGNLNKALDFGQKAYNNFKKIGDAWGEGSVLNNIGNIHYDSGNFQDAMKYYHQAIDVFKKANLNTRLFGPLNGLANTLKQTGQPDKAIPFYEESIIISDSTGDLRGKAGAINNLGLIYNNKLEYGKAMEFFNEAISIYEEIKFPGGIAAVNGDMGEMQLKLKNYQSALKYCKKSYDINNSNGYHEGIVRNCNCLYLALKGLRNYKEALAFHEKWKTNSDSLFSAEKARELTKANMSFEFDNEKKLIALEQKQKEDVLIAKNKQARMVAFGICVFALLALGFFYNSRRQNQLISAQKEQLESLNHTKDRLFAIIGHDLRKPAASFRGISKKIKYLIKKQDFETLDKFGNKIEQNAQSLAKMTDNLLNWALTQRNVMPYNPVEVQVGELAEEIESVFETRATEKQIEIKNNVPSDMTVFADPNALMTILTNLVDNAVKYTPQSGQIIINALESSGNQVKIRVSDTGIGMEKDKMNDLFLLRKEKSKNGTASEKGTGLGLHLVKELVDLNKGLILVASEIGKGTTFEILLPTT